MADLFDLRQDFHWTVNPPSKRNEVPFVEMVAYKLKSSALLTSANFWSNAAVQLLGSLTEGSLDTASTDVYKGLYIVDPEPKSIYVLPWYVSYHHEVTNTYSAHSGKAEELGEIAAGVQKYFNPDAGIVNPQYWNSSNHASYTVSFQLLNTPKSLGLDTGKVIATNQRLIDSLLNASLHTRRSATLMDPPLVFEVTVPGIRFSPAAAITNLQIESVGQLNRMNVSPSQNITNVAGETFSNRSPENAADFGQNIPDAWNINITINELIPETTNIYNAFRNQGQRITAFTDKTLAGKALEALQSKLDEPGFRENQNNEGFVAAANKVLAKSGFKKK